VRIFVFTALFLFNACALASAATGDGKAVYGESATGVLRTRDYTNSTNAVGAEGNATTTATVVTYAVMEANPQADQYIAVSYSNAANDTLYISRWEGGWNLDVTQAGVRDAPTQRGFDMAFEQGTGNALVAYSNGGTSNELSYYYRSCNTTGGTGSCVWTGPCTLELTGTAAALEWIEMDARPNSNEIALAASDTADNVVAAIWSPQAETVSACGDMSTWWTDQSSDLTGANSLNTTTSNFRKFDIAYEQTSGDVLVAFYRNAANTTLDFATNPGSGTG
jgi:hypothetical protein